MFRVLNSYQNSGHSPLEDNGMVLDEDSDRTQTFISAEQVLPDESHDAGSEPLLTCSCIQTDDSIDTMTRFQRYLTVCLGSSLKTNELSMNLKNSNSLVKVLKSTKSKKKSMSSVKTSESSVTTNESLISCPFEGCQKRFTDKRKLYKHKTYHMEKRYVCNFPDCEYKTALKTNLDAHSFTHPFGNIPESLIVCPFDGCGRSFPDKMRYYRHKGAVHSEKRFVCQFTGCKYKTSIKSNINNHSMRHSSDRDFFCHRAGMRSDLQVEG